jgi:hypothetical protein
MAVRCRVPDAAGQHAELFDVAARRPVDDPGGESLAGEVGGVAERRAGRGRAGGPGRHHPQRPAVCPPRPSVLGQDAVRPQDLHLVHVLNTHLPPFNNLLARRAGNYGIDRAQIVWLLGSDPGQDAVTCQILPAGSPSYQRYCPYTIGPQDGSWHEPDLAKARQLAKRSGTTSQPVTVWNFLGQHVGNYLAGLLNQLGYRARLREVSITHLFNMVQDPTTRSRPA